MKWESKNLDIYGDSKLVIKQLLEEYEVKKDDLISYYRFASRFLNKLKIVRLEHVLGRANKMVDALVNLAATLALGAEENMNVLVCNRWVIAPLDEEFKETSTQSVLKK